MTLPIFNASYRDAAASVDAVSRTGDVPQRSTPPVVRAQPAFQERAMLIETNPIVAQRAQIVRDGLPVASLALNESKISAALAGFKPLVSRVVGQSVAPGVPVKRGATVDLVLTRPDLLPIQVIDGVHPGLIAENMQSAFTKYLKDDPELVNIVANAADGATVAAADLAKVRAKAQAKGIAVNDTPGSDVQAVLTGLRAAYTFNS